MSSVTSTKATGALGEQLACKYLTDQNFVIIAQNYHKPFGEIDIIAQKGNTIHYVEVKTVAHETKQDLHTALKDGGWRPEEMVHSHKLHQISKAAEAWRHQYGYTGNEQIDVLALHIVPRETYCTINYIAQAGNI